MTQGFDLPLWFIIYTILFIECLFITGLGKHQEDWLHAEESLKEGIHFYVKVCTDMFTGTLPCI